MKPVWITAALLVASIAFAAEEKKSAAAEYGDENPLIVDAATQKELGIVTAPVTAQALTDELRAPGEVKANAYATTLVSPRIPAQIVAILGLVPMLLSRGVGAETQRPLAAVVVGGLITSTLLTLVLLPVLYEWLEERATRRAEETS
jgi:Cu/Ag efflux pump CusA